MSTPVNNWRVVWSTDGERALVLAFTAVPVTERSGKWHVATGEVPMALVDVANDDVNEIWPRDDDACRAAIDRAGPFTEPIVLMRDAPSACRPQ